MTFHIDQVRLADQIISRIQIPGVKLLVRSTPSDVLGGIYAQCEKHPEPWFSVPLPRTHDWDIEAIVQNVRTTMSQCAGCKRDQKVEYKNTRFPEGAEL